MGIADELITRGWCQDSFEDESGRVCLEGALRRALGPGERETYHDEWWILLRCIPSAQSPWKWNDAPERTFDEVLRVAKQADELIDAQRLTGEI